MSILTTLPKKNSCRYYVCYTRFDSRVQCIKFNSENYDKWTSKNIAQSATTHKKYCGQFENLDKFRLYMNCLNFQMPIIKDN